MENEYRTVKNESSDEFIEKKSRFIGYVKPVESQEEALEFIEQIKKKHWDATHNVYAYVLRENGVRRYSDDGEPQGTAGVPALDVLLKENITDCVVVVTRYFGGIMLGAGGLVRAYSHGAKIALEAGNPITMSLCTVATMKCDYSFYGKASSLIPENGGLITDTVFTDDVEIRFNIKADNFESFRKKVIDQSSGNFDCEKIDEIYDCLEK